MENKGNKKRNIREKDLIEKLNKLEDEKAFSEKLINNADVIILTLDVDANIVTFNKFSETLTDYTREEVIGKNWFEIFIPEKNGNTIPLVFSDILKEMPEVSHYENPILCKDGSERQISWRNTLLKDIDGNISGVLSVGIDVSDVRQSEKSLLESEESYRDLFSNIPDAVLIFDAETNLLLNCNQAAIDKYGYTIEEFKTFTPHKLHPPEELDEVNKNIADEEGKDESYYTHIAKSGKKYLVEVLTEYTIYKGAKAYVSIVRDVTKRKKMEAELKAAKEKAEESDILKSAFLANMSHEIRTPMNAIIGFSNLIESADNKGTRNEFVHIIQRNGEHLLNIINDIVDISKIEAGMVSIEEGKCNINMILDDIYKIYQGREKVRNNEIQLSLNKELQDDFAFVLCDNTRVRQVLINLIDNAYKYTGFGNINFGYSLRKKENAGEIIEFYVKDTGEGIPVDKQDVIFDRFIQADLSSTRVNQGTGLGLAITKALINLMGGKIWFESEPGTGSVFFFSIPFKQFKENIIKKDKKQEIFDINNKTILVAEDEDDSYTLIENILSGSNVNLIRAVDGIDAIDKCKQIKNIDLILMDMRMPEMTGFQATKEIKTFLPDIPVIAQTAYAIAGDKEKVLESGCDDYISKPLNPKLLREKIFKWLS